MGGARIIDLIALMEELTAAKGGRREREGDPFHTGSPSAPVDHLMKGASLISRFQKEVRLSDPRGARELVSFMQRIGGRSGR